VTYPDLVSFGVQVNIIPYIALIIPVFSAYRLAKFNIDTRQTDSFIGLPTPANALFIGSLPFIINGQWSFAFPQLHEFYILLALTILLSLLLVAELPLFALKFKHLKWKDNEIRFVFILSSIILLILLQVAAFPAIILLYVALSVFNKNT